MPADFRVGRDLNIAANRTVMTAKAKAGSSRVAFGNLDAAVIAATL
jgi:hypothetical protein